MKSIVREERTPLPSNHWSSPSTVFSLLWHRILWAPQRRIVPIPKTHEQMWLAHEFHVPHAPKNHVLALLRTALVQSEQIASPILHRNTFVDTAG